MDLNDSVEGFICPHCLVNFASSAKLQHHFLEFHSESGEQEDEEECGIYRRMDNHEEEEIEDDNESGHDFGLTVVKKPRPCSICEDIIWSDSIVCSICQLVCHPKCESNVTQECVDLESSTHVSRHRITAPTQAPAPARGIKNKVKRHVAKGRGRYVDEDFDLDLTYITERIIAMSFPGSGLETTYRNDLRDVAKMLKTKHQENFMIFNLSERSYDISKFNNQVLDFGWPDHLAPSLERLSSICKSMKSWLDSDSSHVAVVHCKGGKGRTGCVISAFMHYTSVCDSAEDALDRFAMKRFYDRKLGGVTQPSQRRYVYYFSDLLSGKISTNPTSIVLKYVIIHGCPDFDGKGGCRPYLKIYQDMKLIHTTKLHNGTSATQRIRMSLDSGIALQGELLFKCFHKRTATSSDSVFRVQFPSTVVQDYAISFSKAELDDAFKDKRFPNTTKVEFIFSPQRAGDSRIKDPSDLVRRSLLAEELIELDPELKRNSYEDFLCGFDYGKPDHKLPPPLIPAAKSLERFAGPKEDLYTSVNKPLKKKPEPAKNTSYTNLSDLNVSKNPAAAVAVEEANNDKVTDVPNHLSYSEVSFDQRPELEPAERRESAADDEMWVTVKWRQQQEKLQQEQQQKQQQQQKHQQHSDLEKSIEDDPAALALSLLDGGGSHHQGSIPMQDYSNLTDINTGQAFIGEVKRTEEDSNKIYIDGKSMMDDSNNESAPTHDYVNHDTDDGKEEKQVKKQVLTSGTYSEIDEVDQIIKKLDEKKKQQNGPMASVPPMSDYVNTSPTPPKETTASLGRPPTTDYYNQETIEDIAVQRKQQQAAASAVAGDEQKEKDQKDKDHKEKENISSEPTQLERRHSKGRQIMNLIKSPFVSSGSSHSAKLSHIQSSAITDDDKTKSLAVFKLEGLDLATTRMDAFMQDSWVVPQSMTEKHQLKSTDKLSQKVDESSKRKGLPPRPQPPLAYNPDKHHHKTPLEQRLSVQPDKNSDLLKKPRKLVQRSHSSAGSTNMKTEESGVNPPAVAPRNYRPTSQLPQGMKRPLIPPVRRPSGKVHNHTGNEVLSEHSQRKGSPPMPREPNHRSVSPNAREITEKEVEELEQYWYKPNFTREEAVEVISHAEPGSFIVRDSQSVLRGYALTIKVSEIIIRRKLKVPADFKVTSDMCVKHFLLQPDHEYPMGIKLQGWNEKPFEHLIAFITGHCNNKLCLPCKLILPSHDLTHISSGLNQSLLTSGAACDLVYVGGVDVAGPGSAALLSSAVQQFKALQLNTTNIVNFKATKDGIIITDVVNGMFVKRQYPIKNISYCAVDASDTRWDFSNVKYKDKIISVHNARCFGFVHRPMEQSTYMCLLFAELESSEQPVHSIVQFVNQLMLLSQT